MPGRTRGPAHELNPYGSAAASRALLSRAGRKPIGTVCTSRRAERNETVRSDGSALPSGILAWEDSVSPQH